MTEQEALGWLLWALILYPIWSPRCWRIRRQLRLAGATPSISGQGTKPALAKTGRQTGPMWEQDKPYAECFESDREIGDDL